MFENLSSTKSICLPKLADRVFDAGVYENLEYDLAKGVFEKAFNPFNGGCTAFSTTIDNGDRIAGRNLDFYISDKPAYVCRTATKDGYKTLGIAYSNNIGPSYQEALKNGVPADIHKMIPFLCTDVLNEKGLYSEINMRCGEKDEKGNQKFLCTGTNPGADTRISVILLQRYIAENCATVEEAVEFTKTLDIFTPTVPGMEWNFCFLMADAQGGYGVLEIAKNKVYWMDKQPIQTNFYINEECKKVQDLQCGIGRYQIVEQSIPSVHNEKDAMTLLKKVVYSKAYDPDSALFDIRSEAVGVKPGWTISFVTDKKNEKMVMDYFYDLKKDMPNMNPAANTTYWNTSYSNVVNLDKKTMSLRFFEEDSITMDLTF